MTGGLDLPAIVERYAAFGNHHTGTDADRLTTDWLVEMLESLGATVVRHPFSFKRFDATVTLTADDGAAVPVVPVLYSGAGNLNTRDLDIVAADVAAVGSAAGLDDLLASPTTHEARVIVLDGPDDAPVHPNRAPVLGDTPAVVIPSAWADRVRQGAELRFDAELVPSTSEVISAQMGPDGAPPVTVTTPLTGWTPCAGERGTGLAVALSLISELGSDRRVEFVGCSGHELDHIGLRHWLEGRDVTGHEVIHLGASVAAIEPDADGTDRLGARRFVLTTADDGRRVGIEAAARGGRWALVDPPGAWPGEGGNWQRAGASVLSFVGQFRYFHTKLDTPANATNPAALTLADEATRATTAAFLSIDDV